MTRRPVALLAPLALLAASCSSGSNGASTTACVKPHATGSRCVEDAGQVECEGESGTFHAGSSCLEEGYGNHCASDARTWYASSDCDGRCEDACMAAPEPSPGGRDGAAGSGPGSSGAAGPCSAGEVFSREDGIGSPELFCHRIDRPPAGVFYASSFCIEIAEDGTGRIDWAGGYGGGTRFVEGGHQRSDDIEEFEWGALIDARGEFLLDPFFDALQLFWHEPGSDRAIDPQVPFLLWDEESATFVNAWPEIVAEPPEEEVKSAACMFGEPRCITVNREELCYAGGYLDGPYRRLDFEGRVEEEGEYTRGERTSTWTRYTYRNGEIAGREEREYGGSEDDYTYRKYEHDVLVEEGGFSGGQRHGLFRYYFGPDSPTDSRPKRAAGLLSSEGHYENGQQVGDWTEYYVHYDIDRPDPSQPDFGSALETWFAEREGVDVCKRREQNHTTGASTSYVYGDPGCPADICNPGLVMIISVPAGGGDRTCTTPGGGMTDCPATVCQ